MPQSGHVEHAIDGVGAAVARDPEALLLLTGLTTALQDRAKNRGVDERRRAKVNHNSPLLVLGALKRLANLIDSAQIVLADQGNDADALRRGRELDFPGDLHDASITRIGPRLPHDAQAP